MARRWIYDDWTYMYQQIRRTMIFLNIYMHHTLPMNHRLAGCSGCTVDLSTYTPWENGVREGGRNCGSHAIQNIHTIYHSKTLAWFPLLCTLGSALRSVSGPAHKLMCTQHRYSQSWCHLQQITCSVLIYCYWRSHHIWLTNHKICLLFVSMRAMQMQCNLSN